MKSFSPFSATAFFSGQSRPGIGPNTLELEQCEYHHDVLTMQFWADNVNNDSYLSGAPMMLLYGRPGNQRSWYGYVNHAQRLNKKLLTHTLVERNSTIVTCVGASYFMKQAGTKVWSHMTADQVIQEIAQMFGLGAVTVPHDMLWKSLPMAGRTYWEFCVWLAHRIGYTFYCNGVQLVFRPRQTNPKQLIGPIYIYDYRSTNEMPIFSPIVGTNNPTGGDFRFRQGYAIEPCTSQIISSSTEGVVTPAVLGTVTQTPTFTERQHFAATSAQELDARVTGAAQLNQLYITATATAVGEPLVQQGSMLFVQNANGSQDGLWFTTRAHHSFSVRTYQMFLELGRDSMGTTTQLSFVPPISNPPQAVLRNNLYWQAA